MILCANRVCVCVYVCVCVCTLLEFAVDKPSHTRRVLRCTMTMVTPKKAQRKPMPRSRCG